MDNTDSQITTSPFRSFIQAGFECSTHKRRDGKRLDLIASTRHDVFIRQDYARLKEMGIFTAREGLRWHLIEAIPGIYDFGSVTPAIIAARNAGIQVIWDLVHFGWPDWVDIFDESWVQALAEMALRFAQWWKTLCGDQMLFVAPVNEISFLSWGGGDDGFFNPFAHRRGGELKAQLVSGALHAIRAIRSELNNVTVISPEPVIHIAGDPSKPGDVESASAYTLAMFQSWDMLSGRLRPELGGGPDGFDIIGINYYNNNQWWNHGPTIWKNDPNYRPFHQILKDVWERYQRPLFIAETGTEGDARPDWFAYIAQEVRIAQSLGIPVLGICLYPILNHPGWEDDRHCLNGLWDYADDRGNRQLYQPLADEIAKQEAIRLRIKEGAHL